MMLIAPSTPVSPFGLLPDWPEQDEGHRSESPMNAYLTSIPWNEPLVCHPHYDAQKPDWATSGDVMAK